MAKGIQRIEIELESICPLLMDKYNEGSKAKTSEDYEREAEEKIYRDEKGLIGIPTTAIKACIRESSSELGMKREGKKNRQMVRAGIFFPLTCIPTGHNTFDSIRKDIVTRGKGDKVTRVLTYRPMFNSWKIKFEANLIGIQPEFVVQALELGGMKYGMLGYRPEFGRFIVKSWRIIK